MCLETEGILLSERYVNSQLAALWENAVKCSEHINDKRGRFTQPWDKFHFPSTNNPNPGEMLAPFYAEFGKPHIEWIHSDAVFLFLEIQTGHIDFDRNDHLVATKHL